MPGLVDVIEHLRALNPGQYVFSWRAPGALAMAHRECRIACGLDDGRVVRHFRKSAIWYWEHVLRLPFDVRVDLAGHSLAVQVKSYRRRVQLDELRSKVRAADQDTARLPF